MTNEVRNGWDQFKVIEGHRRNSCNLSICGEHRIRKYSIVNTNWHKCMPQQNNETGWGRGGHEVLQSGTDPKIVNTERLRNVFGFGYTIQTPYSRGSHSISCAWCYQVQSIPSAILACKWGHDNQEIFQPWHQTFPFTSTHPPFDTCLLINLTGWCRRTTTERLSSPPHLSQAIFSQSEVHEWLNSAASPLLTESHWVS